MESSSMVVLSRELNISRASLYYKPKKPDKDWILKCLIEQSLRGHPSYGSRRIAIELKMNRKKIKRVMNLFGIKPYRRRCRKWKNTKNIKIEYPNLLLTEHPRYHNHIWVSDFTELKFQNIKVYVCTVMDLFSRKVVGLNILTNHSILLTVGAVFSALNTNQKPEIFHSDNGSEYISKNLTGILEKLNIKISRSKPGCPWENGYQESFYDKFKVDLGETGRFKTLGELVLNIYQTIYDYNNTRIHSALKMSPMEFIMQNNQQSAIIKSIKTCSQVV
jgi:transposase InsO family protein